MSATINLTINIGDSVPGMPRATTRRTLYRRPDGWTTLGKCDQGVPVARCTFRHPLVMVGSSSELEVIFRRAAEQQLALVERKVTA